VSAADGHHLAQINVALPLAPLDSEQLAGFVAQLEPVNARADAAPGFVWRLQDDDGDATSFRVLGDDRLIVNLTVWESIEALRAFAYTDAEHVAVLRRRRDWFDRMENHLALWWIEAGTLPTLEDAEERLRLLEAHGPTPQAFTFRTPFAAPVAEPR
jgi:heme-degrading monooxygenase HmoA